MNCEYARTSDGKINLSLTTSVLELTATFGMLTAAIASATNWLVSLAHH